MPALTKPRRPRLDWPLLGKELLEQAARKQMYVVRVVYAVVLFGAFCVYYMQHLAEGPVLTLGRGMGPFQFLVTAQVVTIYLFLPPLMAGAIAQEKERETLGLLFLTSLTPWQLILQKYVGRLIPMLTLLFLSLPLLAVAYSLGGVPIGMLYFSAIELFLACLWVGAVALECSAYAASTFQALVRCWGICLGFVVCCMMGPFPLWALFPRSYGPTPRGLFFFIPTFFTTIFYLVLTFLFLHRAKQILFARAFVQRRNPFGQQFKQLDQYWRDLRKLIRAISRKHDREAYADAEQIIRRELGPTRKKKVWSPGKFMLTEMRVPYLLAFAIIIGTLVLVALIGNVMVDPKSGGAFRFVINGLWILALLTIPIQSANAVASERINERLGPLLTTPLTAPEILMEWLAPVRRWIQFLIRPMIVLFAIEAVIKFFTLDSNGSRWSALMLYLGISVLTVLIYPALVRWSCLWVGLRIRNQIRALMTALLLGVAWCILPLVSAGYLLEIGLLPDDWSLWLRFASPVATIETMEMFGREDSGAWAASNDVIILIFIQLGLAAALVWGVRRICLTNADRYLGRI